MTEQPVVKCECGQELPYKENSREMERAEKEHFKVCRLIHGDSCQRRMARVHLHNYIYTQVFKMRKGKER